MNIKIKFLIVLVLLGLLIATFFYVRNYYLYGDSKEHTRVENIVKNYLEEKYPDKKFIVKFKSFQIWYTIREFTVSTEAEPQKEYIITTVQDRISMDGYTGAIEQEK
jgi:flagellar basal body-associated protein FliL